MSPWGWMYCAYADFTDGYGSLYLIDGMHTWFFKIQRIIALAMRGPTEV